MENKHEESPVMIILAFAAVYLIWGSTYFFIERCVRYFPPMVIGALRFFLASAIIMVWSLLRGEKLWNRQSIIYSIFSGVLLLFVGNGAVIWAEQYLHSSFVAIFLASSPVLFLVLDRPQWKQNFRSRLTLAGVLAGLTGVVLLFYEKLNHENLTASLIPLLVITLGNTGWTFGSLVSKYRVKKVSPMVNSAWQMLAGAIAFSAIGLGNGAFLQTPWRAIPAEAWLSLAYLIVFGSVIGFSAYVFLLRHRSPTQVSSYAYVNPLVAVILGVWLNEEKVSALQLAGLAVILLSVLFINVAKRRKARRRSGHYSEVETV